MDAIGDLFIADTRNNRIRKVGTNGIINTVAGNGTNGYAGDGGAATSAGLSQPGCVTLDATGNLFIADSGNRRVRRLGTNGVINTVAGGGLGGDGGAATNASLAGPSSVALDVTGNLLIVDGGRLREVGSNGVINTAAGNGTNGYAGDGGAATNASLNGPFGVAVSATDNRFISDRYNHCVRQVDTNGIITTLVGTGPGRFGDGGVAVYAGLNGPTAVAVDAAGDLFIADAGNNRIRKVDTNRTITTLAGNGTNGFSGDGGPATNAGLNAPSSLAVDATGNVFITDYGNGRIREVGTNGVITTVAGNGGSENYLDVNVLGSVATNVSFYKPNGVAVDTAGNLFIEDHFQVRIREVGVNGIITSVAGNGGFGFSGDGGVATNASLGGFPGGLSSYPYETYLFNGLAVDAAGNLFIADVNNNRIRKVTFSRANLLANGSLVLNNVSPVDMGNYSVIITTASGSVTSSVVNLNLQLPPLATVFTANNGLCSFTWSAVSNQTYQLQCATNLAAPVWLDLGSPVTATSNAVSASDTVGADGQRFYRVRLWP